MLTEGKAADKYPHILEGFTRFFSETDRTIRYTEYSPHILCGQRNALKNTLIGDCFMCKPHRDSIGTLRQ